MIDNRHRSLTREDRIHHKDRIYWEGRDWSGDNRKLDALVAEKFFGWIECSVEHQWDYVHTRSIWHQLYGQKPGEQFIGSDSFRKSYYPVPWWSTRLDYAMNQIIPVLDSRGKVVIESMGLESLWSVDFRPFKLTEHYQCGAIGSWTELPEMLCRVALSSINVKIPEGCVCPE